MLQIMLGISKKLDPRPGTFGGTRDPRPGTDLVGETQNLIPGTRDLGP